MRRQMPETSIVAAVAQQTAQAADLARIDGQHRLASPHTNPAVRSHADQLRDDEHRRALSALHTRALRKLRVSDRRADNAERTLEVLQAAREMSSPARSVLALHKGRTRFMGAALGASLTLSAGSAIGVAALAEQLHAPAEIGYFAEVGLTGLTTTVILYRSHLAQHGGRLKGWKDIVLWVLMVGPLVASAVANAYGTGGIGVACSIGAAAFSLLSYVIADASAETLQKKAKEVSGADEVKLRRIATGDEPVVASLELAGSVTTGGTTTAAILPPVVDVPTASTAPPVVDGERQESTVSVASDSLVAGAELATPVASANTAPVASQVDGSAEELAATPRQRQPRAAAKGRQPKRRSLTEWVEVAGPIFHEEFERLRRKPTANEFAEAIFKAKLGKISDSTAKNIRTEIIDRTPLPSLDTLTEPS